MAGLAVVKRMGGGGDGGVEGTVVVAVAVEVERGPGGGWCGW